MCTRRGTPRRLLLLGGAVGWRTCQMDDGGPDGGLADVFVASLLPEALNYRFSAQMAHTYSVSGLAVAATDALAFVGLNGPNRAQELDVRRGATMRPSSNDARVFWEASIASAARASGLSASAAIQAPREVQHSFPALRLASAVRGQTDVYVTSRLIEYRDAVYEQGRRQGFWDKEDEESWWDVASKITMRVGDPPPFGAQASQPFAAISERSPETSRGLPRLRLEDLI